MRYSSKYSPVPRMTARSRITQAADGDTLSRKTLDDRSMDWSTDYVECFVSFGFVFIKLVLGSELAVVLFVRGRTGSSRRDFFSHRITLVVSISFPALSVVPLRLNRYYRNRKM